MPAAASTLRAIELLGGAYDSGGRKWPNSLPISFLRPAWRDAIHHAASAGGNERRTWEAATLLALRDRLRSGDIWVEGSRQWRAVEDQLISSALFAAMREAGPLPVAVPATAEEYLADRRTLLNRRLTETAAKAAADTLEDVTIRGDELKVSPLKAITPDEAEALADRFYRAMPSLANPRTQLPPSSPMRTRLSAASRIHPRERRCARSGHGSRGTRCPTAGPCHRTPCRKPPASPARLTNSHCGIESISDTP